MVVTRNKFIILFFLINLTGCGETLLNKKNKAYKFYPEVKGDVSQKMLDRCFKGWDEGEFERTRSRNIEYLRKIKKDFILFEEGATEVKKYSAKALVFYDEKVLALDLGEPEITIIAEKDIGYANKLADFVVHNHNDFLSEEVTYTYTGFPCEIVHYKIKGKYNSFVFFSSNHLVDKAILDDLGITLTIENILFKKLYQVFDMDMYGG